MDTTALIPATDFCRSHKMEISYIHSLYDFGLIKIIETEKTIYLDPDELPRLEQIVQFNRDLEINLEGVEVIFNLLERIEHQQEELRKLRNRMVR